jgi:hypothetical protein
MTVVIWLHAKIMRFFRKNRRSGEGEGLLERWSALTPQMRRYQQSLHHLAVFEV